MRLFILSLLLSIILIPQTASSQQVNTIDELAEKWSIEACADCHEEKHEEWKSSTMGNSVIDPRILRGWRTFIKLELDSGGELSRKDLRMCISCHVPHIKDASDELIIHIADLVIRSVEDKNIAERDAAVKKLSKLNLNCLGCHNLQATRFGSEPEPNTIYVPNKIDGSAHKEAGYETIQSDFLKTSEFCAKCHHCPPSVPWEDCPTLYTTYIEGFKAKGRNETCQDCHMQGEEKSHRFLGPNDPDFLNDAVTLDINARPTNYINNYNASFMPAVVLDVKLTNHAGHTIPHG
jgi:hypothetical protein